MNAALRSALINPERVFSDPQDVVRSETLTTAEKREILSRWAHDALELSVAAEEGMAGDEPAPLAPVAEALAQLDRGETA